VATINRREARRRSVAAHLVRETHLRSFWSPFFFFGIQRRAGKEGHRWPLDKSDNEPEGAGNEGSFRVREVRISAIGPDKGRTTDRRERTIQIAANKVPGRLSAASQLKQPFRSVDDGKAGAPPPAGAEEWRHQHFGPRDAFGR